MTFLRTTFVLTLIITLINMLIVSLTLCFQTGPFKLLSPPLTTYNQQLWLTCVMEVENKNRKTPEWAVLNVELLPTAFYRFVTHLTCFSWSLQATLRHQRRPKRSDAGRQRDAHQPSTPEVTDTPVRGCEYQSHPGRLSLSQRPGWIRC